MVKIKLKRINNDAVTPFYAKEGDAGLDLFSVSEHILKPGERCLVKTGLSFEIPRGYEIQIRPRSGLALKNGISLVNSPGTVDSGYRGEICIIVINHGNENFEINKGDKIAQAVLNKFENAEIEEVECLEGSLRGEDGFGSTGN
ncbi:MAG: dUTP diphosphatase [Candidatus Pacearchaeota archaeon]